MPPVYNPADDETYFVVYGDNWRYRDLIADGGTFDPAMMAVGYDDSAWSVGPQPFRNGYATSFFTFDKFGQVGGIPNVAGTVVTASPTDMDVVARTTFTVPGNAVAPRVWITTITATNDMELWLDGIAVDVLGPTSGFSEFSTLDQGPLAAGVHHLAFHLSGLSAQPPGFTAPGGMGGATVGLSHIYSPKPPRLRQFPRDDSLGGAPRQGKTNGPTSVQGSTRQGWRGTYR